MTTIDESKTAKGYTPAADVLAVFGQPRTIQGIVIHHWGLTGQTHEGVVDFFVNGPGATSAHFVASAGKLTCLVSPVDAAWHCPGKNATHIGIECRPEATDADYATVAELVRFLRATYGPLPLSMHRDWYSTACPGVWDINRIDALAQVGGAATSTPQEDTLSAAEVNQIIKAISDARIDVKTSVAAVPAAVWGTTVNRGGKLISALQELADAKTAAQQTAGKPVPAVDVKALAVEVAALIPSNQAHDFIVALGQALPKE